MSKIEVGKVTGKYVDIVCGTGDRDADGFGGVLTSINENGYACVDWGYGIKIEHIINIKPADLVSSEENTLD